jgi:two-component system, NarL family, response regulator NreC
MAKNFIDAGDQPAGDAPVLPLTEREIQVVTLLAQGKSNKEVAAALEVSTRTVESHRNHIMKKMEFESFSDLVRFAVCNNLVDP